MRNLLSVMEPVRTSPPQPCVKGRSIKASEPNLCPLDHLWRLPVECTLTEQLPIRQQEIQQVRSYCNRTTFKTKSRPFGWTCLNLFQTKFVLTSPNNPNNPSWQIKEGRNEEAHHLFIIKIGCKKGYQNQQLSSKTIIREKKDQEWDKKKVKWHQIIIIWEGVRHQRRDLRISENAAPTHSPMTTNSITLTD